MRHTYATMLLMAGATPAYAAKQMGHSVEMYVFERLFQVAGRRSGGYRAGEAGVLHRTKLPRNSPEKTKIVISLCFRRINLERVMGIEPGSVCLILAMGLGFSLNTCRRAT